MSTYKLSGNAKEDLFRIFHYGVENYGSARAESYYEDLFTAFSKIAEHPLLYPTSSVRSDYRIYTLLPDTIYYRINNDLVEVMAILRAQDESGWV